MFLNVLLDFLETFSIVYSPEMYTKENNIIFLTIDKSQVFIIPIISEFSNKFTLLNISKGYSGIEFDFAFSCVQQHALQLFTNKKKKKTRCIIFLFRKI